MKKGLVITVFMILLLLVTTACSEELTTPTSIPTVTPSVTNTPTPGVTYSPYRLEYILWSKYPDIFWNDPDFYPIAREGQEQANALQQFPVIQANSAEFSALLEHLGLTNKTDYTDAEKLSIYREHKLLTRAITMTPSGSDYNFSLRTGENQGLLIEGTITSTGQIKITKEEPTFNTHPICLTMGTLIDTPTGAIPVEQLQPGMIVWTMDKAGIRVTASIIKISSTPVPSSFQVVKLTLNDGRTVTTSPGHPSAEMRSLGDYRVRDTLDRGQIVSIERIPYNAGATYDLLPSGGTGLYWANGILLMSTLIAN